MQITDIKVRKLFDEGPMKAIVSVTFDGQLAVHDIKVIYARDKYFIVMPSRKNPDDTYRDIVHPINAQFRGILESAVIAAYETELKAAKEAQAHLEDKINRLKTNIAEAKIVDTSRLNADLVQILSKVEMTNMGNNAKMTYTIVSESEADLRAGKISIKTPIAQGLLNKKVGDVVEIKIPRGTIRLRIDKITIS